MKYGNEMDMSRDVPCAMPVAQENLTERMRATAEMGGTVKDMVRRIRGSLFGHEPTEGEAKEKTPECMEELIEKHRRELVSTARVLEEICARLGGQGHSHG